MPNQPTETNPTLQALREGLGVSALLARVERLEAELAAYRQTNYPIKSEVKRWYNLEEAAHALNFSPRKIRYLIEEGKLSKNLHSRRILIPASEIEKFTERSTLPRF